MTKVRPLYEVLTLIREECINRGFGIYGICCMAQKLHKRKMITTDELRCVVQALIKHVPPNTRPHGYFWPTTKEFEQTRIDFLSDLITIYNE